MRYGIGTLRDNQRTRLCPIWINCVWKKSVLTMKRRSCDRPATFDVSRSRDMIACHDVTWRDTTWHYVTWHDVTWRGKTCHDVTWHDMTWHNVTLHDITWHDVAWHDKSWHDVAWRDMTRGGSRNLFLGGQTKVPNRNLRANRGRNPSRGCEAPENWGRSPNRGRSLRKSGEGSGEGARWAPPQKIFEKSNLKAFILVHIWSNYLKWLYEMVIAHFHEKSFVIIWCDGIIKFCWSIKPDRVSGGQSKNFLVIKVPIQAVFVSFIIQKIYQWFVSLSVKKNLSIVWVGHGPLWPPIWIRHWTWREITWLNWRNLTWLDVVWRGMTWHDVTWRGMTWHGMTWR